MAFYELRDDDGVVLIAKNSIGSFLDTLDEYVEMAEMGGIYRYQGDTDSFWDDFWGGFYYIDIDGMEFHPLDFITAAYWADTFVGVDMPHWMLPGPVNTIDDLYQYDEYESSAMTFELILGKEAGLRVDSPEVLELFNDPSVVEPILG